MIPQTIEYTIQQFKRIISMLIYKWALDKNIENKQGVVIQQLLLEHFQSLFPGTFSDGNLLIGDDERKIDFIYKNNIWVDSKCISMTADADTITIGKEEWPAWEKRYKNGEDVLIIIFKQISEHVCEHWGTIWFSEIKKSGSRNYCPSFKEPGTKFFRAGQNHTMLKSFEENMKAINHQDSLLEW